MSCAEMDEPIRLGWAEGSMSSIVFAS